MSELRNLSVKAVEPGGSSSDGHITQEDMKADRQHFSPQTSLYLGCLPESVAPSEDRFFFLSSSSLEDTSQQTRWCVSEGDFGSRQVGNQGYGSQRRCT